VVADRGAGASSRNRKAGNRNRTPKDKKATCAHPEDRTDSCAVALRGVISTIMSVGVQDACDGSGPDPHPIPWVFGPAPGDDGYGAVAGAELEAQWMRSATSTAAQPPPQREQLGSGPRGRV
jgi:hypothetical protein